MREELAALMHEIRAGWMRYVFRQTVTWEGKTMLIPAWDVERWTRQIAAPYDELSEKEKDSNRRAADKVLMLLAEKLLVANTVIERNPAQSMPERIAEAHYAMVGRNLSRDPVSVDVIARWLVYIEEGVKCEDSVPVGANFDGDWAREE